MAVVREVFVYVLGCGFGACDGDGFWEAVVEGIIAAREEGVEFGDAPGSDKPDCGLGGLGHCLYQQPWETAMQDSFLHDANLGAGDYEAGERRPWTMLQANKPVLYEDHARDDRPKYRIGRHSRRLLSCHPI